MTKIKQLMDENKKAREKIRDLEGKVRSEDRTFKSQHEHMVRLEEKYRELKTNVNTVKPA